MATEIIKNQTPEELELEKKQAELAALEVELIQCRTRASLAIKAEVAKCFRHPDH